jgi:precorrin-2 dehydrogenase/sirohydrochlorin ferrochelatase
MHFDAAGTALGWTLMDVFPAFFPLKGLRVVIAGDGEAMAAKTRLLSGSPAEVVRLIGPEALDSAAYEGAGLIFVASFDPAYASAAAAAARRAGAPLNVVDHPELSDFHTPAIVDRGGIVAAVGTTGAAPLIASLLRAEVEMRIPPSAEPLAALLGERRTALREAFPDLPARRAFLRSLLAGPIADAAGAGDLAEAARALDAAIESRGTFVGRVSFIDTPSAADLLSVRAVRVLNFADILVIGDGAAPLADVHARRDAERWSLEQAAWTPDLEAAVALQARGGRLIAVVDRVFAQPAWSRLAAQGVAVERLKPAPGP